MSLDNLSREEIKSMSMLDLAQEILLVEKKAINFKDIFDKIAELKGYSEDQKDEFLAQFYTDLNLDGRFITLGANMWGMKRWYPVEQMDEDIHNEPKKKKKSKKKIVDDEDLDEDDLDLDLVDDEDDIVDDFDDIDEDEDDDDFEEIDEEDDDDDIDDELENLNEIDEDELDDDFEDEK
ncbi:DNA-directed RNA polymerase subunit delta [Ornithinibacillus contaminans]|uniref:DNA-directed RNA polymerase subunit delta n=1 Tax=Ornithinibacillus contaminans TaxID=694055 RepID=UPI00064DEA51|nr:DNA-directed RNA polymerase subunit delta [Ornithinibacillus contaminans]